MVKIIKMSTEIHEHLFVYDVTGKATFKLYLNDSSNICLTDDFGEDNPYATYLEITTEDWKDIKQFIDKQFKQ